LIEASAAAEALFLGLTTKDTKDHEDKPSNGHVDELIPIFRNQVDTRFHVIPSCSFVPFVVRILL
jgi:hypothetical protein